MFASNTLEGKTILITRPSSQTTESIEAVRRHGGNPLVFPVLAIMDPDSWDACDTALKGIQVYDAVVFTSANGVSGLDKRATALGLSMNVLAQIPVYAVGDATAARLLKRGVPVAAVPQNHSAEGLREIFEGKPVNGKRFLLVQGSIARQDLRDSLEGQGAITGSVVVFREIAAEV